LLSDPVLHSRIVAQVLGVSIVDTVARGTMTFVVINTVGILARPSNPASDRRGSQTRATGCRKRCHLRNFLLLVAFSVVFRTIAIAEVPEVRRVLVFNDFDQIASPGIALLDQGIFAALSHSRYQIEWYGESLEANLFTDEDSQRRILDWYIRKYKDRKPDIIIAVGPASLQFMIESHEKFFLGVPIVFCGSSEDMLEKLKPNSSFTGVWGVVQPEETLTAALRLQPSTKHVVVVGGVGTYDRHLEDIVKQSLRNYESRLEFTYLTDLDMPTLLRRVGQLPSNTIVLYTSIFQDAVGRHFIDANQSSPAVIDASNAPVFILFDVNFGTGAVGGDIISFASDGTVAGHMAVRILDGEQLQSIPVVKNADVWTFDWRALRRWGFKERDLPPGSIVLDRQPTLWESYEWYIITGFSLIVVETMFIVALLWQRARRTKAEQALREAEERLRLAQQVAQVGSFEWNIQTGVNTWTPELETMYGLQPGTFAGTQAAFENLVHPDDREGVIELVDRALKTGQPMQGEWRVVWADRSVHWITGRWQVLMDASGEPSKMIGVNIDVTEQKLADEARLEVNRTLEAQAALLQSREELLKIFVENVPAAVAMLDRDMRYLQVSNRWRADYLRGKAQLEGRSHQEIFPDMPERWKEVHRRALQGEILRADEDRWDGQDGTHWARWEVRPWKTAEGAVGGILILAEDITRRKQMEEALSSMSRKLIESQEQERARIARELHDDINQRLAMLAVGLEQLQENPSEVQSRVQELRNQTTELSNDVQAMSRELHSSKLEYLGVVAGIKSWCKEFGERQRVEIDFSNDVHSALPFEIGLSLFRVLQEALHNATKHSGVKRIEVQLREDSSEVHLIIRDSGKGFDVEAALQGKGLGLTSMHERVRMVNGTISIESKPMGGTTIRVRMPLGSEKLYKRAAGE
jgi:PAS domain S-box-containing protein